MDFGNNSLKILAHLFFNAGHLLLHIMQWMNFLNKFKVIFMLPSPDFFFLFIQSVSLNSSFSLL